MPHVAALRAVLPDPSKPRDATTARSSLGVAAGIAAGELAHDTARALIRYHQSFAGPGGRTIVRKSWMCAVRLAPWSEGAIRPHEATLPSDVADELAAIRHERAHTMPVLAAIRDPAGELSRLFRKTEATAPTLSFTTADGVTHTLWRERDAELFGKLRTYLVPKKLHVLDGHARYEAMLAYQAELAANHSLSMYSSANYGLFCIVPIDDPGLVPAARHKVVRGVTTPTAEILAAASRYFIVEQLPGAATDLAALGAALGNTVAHQPAVVIVFAGDADAWKLTLSPEVSPAGEGVSVDRRIAKLDPVVLDGLLLAKAFAGGAITTEIDATRALVALGARGDAEPATAAIIARPLTIDQIAHVDDLGLVLPPRSTAFYPPISDGLIAMVIDPDEDLV